MSKVRKAFLAALVLAAAQGLAVPAQAQQPTAPASAPGYTLPFTHMWDMTSEAGETYRIFVSYPAVEAPAEGFPVLYVLDGNASFAAFAEARRLQEFHDVGKSIVVGVGYPTEQPYDVRRLDDLTAPLPDPLPPGMRRFAKLKSGGRDKFLDFLTGKLRTEIGRRYKVDPGRQSLFGHSLGGLLALHALYTRPQAFHAIIAASPSLEWDTKRSLREERAFTERLKSGTPGGISRLMVVVGSRDTDDNPEVGAAFARRMEQLSGHGLRTRFRRYDEEGHMTVPSRAVTDTLRFAFELP